MGITNLSALSIESGVSCATVETAAVISSTVSLTGALSAAAITSSGISMVGAGQLSLRTVAAASSLGTTELGVVMQASGLSLIYRSDDTAYTVGASAVSAAI